MYLYLGVVELKWRQRGAYINRILLHLVEYDINNDMICVQYGGLYDYRTHFF